MNPEIPKPPHKSGQSKPSLLEWRTNSPRKTLMKTARCCVSRVEKSFDHIEQLNARYRAGEHDVHVRGAAARRLARRCAAEHGRSRMRRSRPTRAACFLVSGGLDPAVSPKGRTGGSSTATPAGSLPSRYGRAIATQASVRPIRRWSGPSRIAAVRQSSYAPSNTRPLVAAPQGELNRIAPGRQQRHFIVKPGAEVSGLENERKSVLSIAHASSPDGDGGHRSFEGASRPHARAIAVKHRKKAGWGIHDS